MVFHEVRRRFSHWYSSQTYSHGLHIRRFILFKERLKPHGAGLRPALLPANHHSTKCSCHESPTPSCAMSYAAQHVNITPVLNGGCVTPHFVVLARTSRLPKITVSGDVRFCHWNSAESLEVQYAHMTRWSYPCPRHDSITGERGTAPCILNLGSYSDHKTQTMYDHQSWNSLAKTWPINWETVAWKKNKRPRNRKDWSTKH